MWGATLQLSLASTEALLASNGLKKHPPCRSILTSPRQENLTRRRRDTDAIDHCTFSTRKRIRDIYSPESLSYQFRWSGLIFVRPFVSLGGRARSEIIWRHSKPKWIRQESRPTNNEKSKTRGKLRALHVLPKKPVLAWNGKRKETDLSPENPADAATRPRPRERGGETRGERGKGAPAL